MKNKLLKTQFQNKYGANSFYELKCCFIIAVAVAL